MALLFLGTVTVLLVIAAPLVMRLYLNSSYDDPGLAAQRDSAIAFARLCLPQVFFYGMFVLLGQVLNARGRFGPMMWAPIANNVIAILVLVGYLVWFGPLPTGRQCAAFTGQPGAGPRPRLDPRHRRPDPGAAPLPEGSRRPVPSPLRLPPHRARTHPAARRLDRAVRDRQPGGLHRRGPARVRRYRARGACGLGHATQDSTGYTVYAAAFLFVMVPHAIITVSLATAILPRLSAKASDGDLPGLAATLAGTVRTALALVVPFAFLLPLVAYDAAKVLFGYGATSTTFDHYVPSMILFGPGVVFFTVHYLMLRGFYALEQNRTVFFIQCGIAATNVAWRVVLVSQATPKQTSPALVLAYLSSYVLGATASYLILRSRLGGLETPQLVRFLVRLLIAATVSTAVAWAVGLVLPGAGTDVTPPVGGCAAGRTRRRRRRRLPLPGARDAADRGHHAGGHGRPRLPGARHS